MKDPRTGVQKDSAPGAIFISDDRVVFEAAKAHTKSNALLKAPQLESGEIPKDGIWQFAMTDIHSIGGSGNGLTGALSRLALRRLVSISWCRMTTQFVKK